MKSEEAVRLKKSKKRFRRLKQIVADQALDIQMLKHINELNLVGPARKRAAVDELQSKFSVP